MKETRRTSGINNNKLFRWTMLFVVAAMFVVIISNDSSRMATAFIIAPQSLARRGINNNNIGIQQQQQQQQQRGANNNKELILLLARRQRPKNNEEPDEQKLPPMNDEITSPQVRVVLYNPSGKDEALGVLSLQDALERAGRDELDLIMMNDKTDPPVCRIADYSKMRYILSKKAKETKRMSKASELKEVKMSYKIDEHDYQVRKRNALKFLNQGNRVRCTIQFRGREVQHDNLGIDLLNKLAQDLNDVCTMDGRPKREGRVLFSLLSPRAEVLKARSEERRANKKAKEQQKQQKRKEEEEKEKDVVVVKKTTQDILAATEVGTTTTTTAATTTSALSLEDDSLLSSFSLTDDDNEKDDDDDEINKEKDVATSLDALLGSSDLTQDLFG